ncbi:MAG: alpha/beta hydrolase [Rhodovulum sulfidophilum]|uniref:Alpha/beta hydrolase n=1 Tax=Rhodovulum sulfidophilum TaxID=35806 RepID=A0A2W5N2K7_RHOSU|nr:MAG: alpha/beta hydrolase [Rhodovulum sulfidophilum]
MIDQIGESAAGAELMWRAAARQATTIAGGHDARLRRSAGRLAAGIEDAAARLSRGGLPADWAAYLLDRAQRAVLTLDTLRERGDVFVAHEAAGCPPVLVYDYEVVVDGRDLGRPCNYLLLRIVPPEGVTVIDTKRPYVIIDPRAGHGAGIGGFKFDSQVGVALSRGNPVYFVGFRRDPEPGQTLADVTRAEAEFVREVMRRHPDSPKPVVIGNCQGGWATLLLAITNPDLTGPIVLNGAPVGPWSGEVGTNPMRYNAGVTGGAWQAMFLSDIGGGVFDGAHLVMNFENLNPSRNYVGKYYDLFAAVDTDRERFLDFERWWGGFFRLNESEIRWIVEQLFVGNRLARNTAQLEPGRPLDIKAVRAPIIVFASRGDNITPPQQALNWIVDTYPDVDEIRVRGQRIVYMLHEEVGHLGIFVSASVARKEHTQVSSVMRTIESLAPGLYEMKIESAEGQGIDRAFTVAFYERTLGDLREIDENRADEAAFGAVDRFSETQAEIYDVLVRPLVKAMVTPATAEAGRALHPLRASRAVMSGRNPMTLPLRLMAGLVAGDRRAADAANPFVAAEGAAMDMMIQAIDLGRDLRDAFREQAFFALWNAPWARTYGASRARPRTLKDPAELRALPEVVIALGHLREGGFAHAVIRMLVLLAESRGSVRRDRLERSAQVLAGDEPFRSIPVDERRRIIDEQTLIASFAGEEAITTLRDLLPSQAERELALRVARYVPGRVEEMAPHTLELLMRLHEVLGVPAGFDDVLEDPLATPGDGEGSPRTAAE